MKIVILLFLFLLIGIGGLYFGKTLHKADTSCKIYIRKNAPDKNKRSEMYPTQNDTQKVDVKFMEGAQIRLRNNKLISLCDEDLTPINNLFSASIIQSVNRLYTSSEAELNREYTQAIVMNPNIADLNLWYVIVFVENVSLKQKDEFINSLNNYQLVEIAEPEAGKVSPANDLNRNLGK